MSYPCIPESGYLDSPEFLSFSLHITTAFSTPVHILGLYFILFKTPDQMKSVKWYLVNLHTWIVLFDYSVGLLTVPLILLPQFAGYPFGLLAYFGVPNVVQAFVVLLFLGYVVVSIVAIFENRFYIICDFYGKKYWEWLRRPWLLFQYAGILMVLASFVYLTPNQNSAVEQVLKSLPCLPKELQNMQIFVLAENHTYHLTMLVIFILGTGLEVLFFLGCCLYTIFKRIQAKVISQKTSQMQKKFFLALLIQMTIPLLMLTVPFIYAWIVVLKNYHNQALTNFAVITSSLHGFVSTLVMLFAHHPYRKELLVLFYRSSGTPEKRVRTKWNHVPM